MRAIDVECAYIGRRQGRIFQCSKFITLPLSISKLDELFQLKYVPKQQMVWHKKGLNILLAPKYKTKMDNAYTFIYSTLCLRHNYILCAMSHLCPETSISSFVCKMIGHLFIARGCDTKII
jgi:hypothetical protein